MGENKHLRAELLPCGEKPGQPALFKISEADDSSPTRFDNEGEGHVVGLPAEREGLLSSGVQDAQGALPRARELEQISASDLADADTCPPGCLQQPLSPFISFEVGGAEDRADI